MRGLVSISGWGMIDVWVSIIIGFVAGLVYVRASKMLVIFRVTMWWTPSPSTSWRHLETLAPALFVQKFLLLKYPGFPERDVRGGVQGALRAVHGLRTGTYWEPTCSSCLRSCCGSASFAR